MLDSKVCTRCANHDNEVVEADKSFLGGEVPGQVHPFCRCVSVMALHSADLSLAHAVTRDLLGPGLGRIAVGKGNLASPNWDTFRTSRRAAGTNCTVGRRRTKTVEQGC